MYSGVEPLTASLRDVCFVHWPVSEERVAERMPGWLTPDVADGSAWISAVFLEMDRFDVFGLPVRENVGAITVRTYVRSPRGDRGVYFLSVGLTDRSAAEAARRLVRFPFAAADVERSSNGDETRVRVSRREEPGATLDVTYEPTGATQTASPDTLASFLVERYRYYTEGPLGTRLAGSVGHDAWRLQSARASVRDATLVPGVTSGRSERQPLAHFSDGTAMRIGPPVPLSAPM